MSLPETELRMTQYILDNDEVHYSDLTSEFNISKPTVTKYLNQLSERIADYDIDVTLIRDRTSGIFFAGDLIRLREIFAESSNYTVPDTPEDRQTFIIATLIFNKDRITIAKLSEQLFVSRRTVEADLTKVRNYINENGGKLVNNSGSLTVKLPDKIKYPFLIEVVHKFWGNKLMTSSHNEVLFPPILNSYFKQSDTKKIFKIVDEFINQYSYKLTDYEYETLIIYLILQLSLTRHDEDCTDSPVSLEEETIQLSNNFNQTFSYQLNVEQLIYLNNFIILIKLENHIVISHDDDFIHLQDDIKSILTDYDEQLAEGLYQHLSGALRRNKFGMKVTNPYTEQIKIKFSLSFEEALDLVTKLGTDLSEDEVAFTALHFESYFERRRTPDAPVSAVIVCNTGIGTSRLLEEKINQNMRNAISVERILRSHEVVDSKITEDLIISTVPLNNIEQLLVVVSPFLTDNDKLKIKKAIQVINVKNESFDYFTKLFDEKLVFVEKGKINYETALTKITQVTEAKGYAKNGLLKAAMEREQISSTAVEGIALPHADIKFVEQPFIAVMISKKGIQWQSENVKIAFFMGMNKQVDSHIRKIYHYLNEIIDDKEKIYELENAKNTTEILNIITGENR